MTESDILKLRLHNHLITSDKLNGPESVVGWMGAIQAQDFSHAKYAISSRAPGSKIGDVERSIDDRKIVRTWALRGTLHILSASDIYWMLPLVAKNILSRYQPQFKKLNLDDKDFSKIHRVLVRLLRGGMQLTRKELFAGLETNKISTTGLRGNFLLYKAAWLGIICLGSMKGSQDTYTLLEEWLPKPTAISAVDALAKTKDDAAAKLAQRYFQSHGPATLKDFTSWSGLTITESRIGLELIRETLTKVEVEEELYWMSGANAVNNRGFNKTYFLAGFDEYLLGYKDRSLVLDAADTKKVILPNGIFKPVIIKQGKIIGTWNGAKNEKNIF